MIVNNNREQLNIVIIGHVDHGKSTILGRLLADTDALPDGKLEFVKSYCEKNSKTFEYAFLLDALKEEQSQGITIDAARCFFKTKKRDYLIFDAPGHFEFIKNMITGASRADAAIIVIDALEGIKENTKRHGYLLSLLGIENICVAVNKMDLVDYSHSVYNNIISDYNNFLNSIGINNVTYIPLSARNGDNITKKSINMPWYNGIAIIDIIESWQKINESSNIPFRFSVQDIYKFTSNNDDRRILAGTIDYGNINKNDKVVFYPSNTHSVISSIEYFPFQIEKAGQKESVGFTIADPFYISEGELMVKEDEFPKPFVSKKFLTNIFWMEKNPLLLNKSYNAKIGNKKTNIRITEIHKIIDATDPECIINKDKLERYDIGICVVETTKPVAFDTIRIAKNTSRFVIIDKYHIAGCGIIVEKLDEEIFTIEKEIERKNEIYIKSNKFEKNINQQNNKSIIITGSFAEKQLEIANLLEKNLIKSGKNAYFLSLKSIAYEYTKNNITDTDCDAEIKKLGEISHILNDAGVLFITSIYNLDSYEQEILKTTNYPYEMFVIGIEDTIQSDVKYNIKFNYKQNSDEIVNKIIKYLNA